MTRVQLEHIIRAAGTVADVEDLIVVGSQAILGEFPDAPEELLLSNAHGVSETTATLPSGWRDRLILVSGENTRFVRGWCLEVHDLAIAKYAAGWEKDRDFTRALARRRMVRKEILEERLAATELSAEIRRLG